MFCEMSDSSHIYMFNTQSFDEKRQLRASDRNVAILCIRNMKPDLINISRIPTIKLTSTLRVLHVCSLHMIRLEFSLVFSSKGYEG